jgi:hypothetical protein
MNTKAESMTDSVPGRPEVFVDPKTHSWKRIRYPKVTDPYIRGLGPNRAFKPVNACSHTTTKINAGNPSAQLTFVGSKRGSTYDDQVTWIFQSPAVALKVLTGVSANEFGAMLSSATNSYSAGAYKGVDWFALASSFQEACESFTKSKFLLGEDLYENAIFVDAFKILVNPASALNVLMKHLRHGVSPGMQKKFRRMTLGEFARSTHRGGKKAINWHLSYDFAVKPAIDDIKAALDAHSYVSKRMRLLQSYGGSYLPVRVRQDLMSDFTNTTPTKPSLISSGTRSYTFKNVEYKRTRAVISAWGRVRPDLDWNDTWSAYLQYFGVGKMIGLAWELIPGSFLLDWVTDAQEKINDLTRLRSGGPFMGIRNISASLKQETREIYYLWPGYEPIFGFPIKLPDSPVKICHRDIISYSRYREIPQTSGLVDISNLGSFHYAKLAELIIQLWT